MRTLNGLLAIVLVLLSTGVDSRADDEPDAGLAVYRQAMLAANTRVYEGEVYWWNGEAIEDADAQNGRAQWASPEVHSRGHAYVFCSGNDTTLRPARYQLTFRLKVLSRPEPPVAACNILAYNHSGTKHKLLFDDRKSLSTADFPAAGVYRNFTITLERYDVSFAAFAVQWHKKVEIVVDRVTVTPERLFTDAELCAKAPLLPPTALPADTPPSRPLRVLVVAGPYHRHFRLEAAMTHLPGVAVDVCRAEKERNHGCSLKPAFPDAARLSSYAAVLLLDVPAAPLHLAGRLALKEYVHNGGGVLVAGGPFAFGGGGYEGTFLADILPVKLDSPWGLLPADEGQEVRATASPLLAGLFTDERPAAGWYHRFGTKVDSTVLMAVGETPLLATGHYGQGRVAALGATPLGGSAAAGQSLLQCADWPELCARVLMWTAAPQR